MQTNSRIHLWATTLVCLLFTLSNALYAQHSHSHLTDAQGNALERNCYSMDVLDDYLRADPTAIQRMLDIEQHTQDFIRNGATPDRAVVTIPVVVHVIYKASAENISDAQIMSQINVLNQDFRRTNADKTTKWAQAADSEIEFCMAKTDPNGNPTTGITRTLTTVTSFSTNDAMKYSSQGGKDAWPSGSYMNVWVCNIGGGILGYAQFPGSGSAATDGVVIGYKYFGTTGTVVAPFNKGRTATHEVGHWLNLRHIWGDGGCSVDDFVTDTPSSDAANYGCTPTHVSCSTADMVENYMDYSDDACMNLFTAGQKARMQAVLAVGGARRSLVTSNGCSTGGAGTCTQPASLATAGISSTGVTLSWATVSAATNYTVQIKPSSSSTWTSFTATTASLSLTGLTASTTYNWQVRTNCSSGSTAYTVGANFTTSAASGCSDIYESNNTLSAAKTIPVNTNITALLGLSTDKDYFKFSNTSANKNIRVTLSNLPLDYDLKLYNSAGTLLYTSQNGGTTTETIIYNNAPVGTYTIYVYGYGGVYSATNCYTLNASIGSATFRDGGELNVVPKEEILETEELADFSIRLYPNPASETLNVQVASQSTSVRSQIYDVTGRVLWTDNLSSGDNMIQLSALPTGIYYLTVLQNDGKMLTEKFVKTN